MSRIIAHRGNLLGPSKRYENTFFAIEKCIADGFDVEIDVRHNPKTGAMHLGHDMCREEIDLNYFNRYGDYLWIHCKTFEVLNKLKGSGYNYFWHQDDKYTLTSHRYIWAHPSSFPPSLDNTVLVMPESNSFCSIDCEFPNTVYGVCSDYPYEIKFT
jgi:hypothetical protein